MAAQFIDLERALPACRNAVERDADNARELTRLARVLETQLTRGEDIALRREMMDALERAASLDDPRAQLALARWFRTGAPGFAADAARAAQLEQSGMAGLRREAADGAPQAKVMLGHAIAADYLADDVFNFVEEGEQEGEAWRLMTEGGAGGADRLLFDIYEGLERSGFCDRTTPYDYRNVSNNAREQHCSHLRLYLDRSTDPIVAYESAVRLLAIVKNNAEFLGSRTVAQRRELSAIWRSTNEHVSEVIARFERLSASDNERVADAARRGLPEILEVQAHLQNMRVASDDGRYAQNDDEGVIALVALIAGAVILVGTARAAGGGSTGGAQSDYYRWTPPDHQCTYADSHGLVYTVPC